MHLGTVASPTATVIRRTETAAAQQRILNTLGIAGLPAISDITLARQAAA